MFDVMLNIQHSNVCHANEQLSLCYYFQLMFFAGQFPMEKNSKRRPFERSIVSQPSECLKFMTFREGYFVIRN